jgi:N-methylhydantoinase A
VDIANMSATRTLRVASDVGGTFTDLVCVETDAAGAQRLTRVKVDTTPPDFEQGVLDALRKAGVVPADIAVLAHGTTVIINALTERKGARVALITTQGFRDVLEIARGNRPDYFNLRYRKPEPFVPRHWRAEVPGRLTHDGREREAVDVSGLAAIVADFRRDGVEAIAVCLLHAYADPRHELAVLAEIGRRWPEVPRVASHQISREWREYERTNTAVLSAYVQPLAERYLGRLQQRLEQAGFGGQLYLMQSNCGVDTVERTRRIPITMIESGPASGFWGAAELGRRIGEGNVLALDIGGTTAKCSLIEHGQVRIMTDYWIERDARSAGYPLMVPVVDLVEIGNGGGSIAWVDDFGKLRVGPRSAGAQPGPAAYGRGGSEVTTTDANLALGRINPEFFCGGEIVADMDAVAAGLDAVAARLGLTRAAVARGIVRIADDNMVNALKLVSLNRGHDPRDFTLVAFGGGGGMHAVALASELHMRKVIVPRAAEVFSAWGMLVSDLRRDYFISRLLPLRAASASALAALVAQADAEAQAQFAAEGVGAAQLRLQRYAKLRYENQEHAVEVPFDAAPLDDAALAAVAAIFHASYEREYSYRLDAPVEFVGLHLVACAEVGKLALKPLPSQGRAAAAALKGRRLVDYAGAGIHQADIYDGALLDPGARLRGPAVIESAGTTIVVYPGNAVHIDDYGNTHIHLRETA